MSEYVSEKCISPDKINVTLKRVFEFIVQNQIISSGYLEETNILLKISLTQTQTPTTGIRQSAENTVTGIVTQVADTYVVMLARTKCSDKYSEYTVEYNKIIYLNNVIFSVRYNQFKEYILNKVPRLCYENYNQYIDMIENLNADLIRYKDNQIKDIKVIFDGVNSRVSYNKDIETVRNFVLFERYFLFPITSISGYIIAPKCTTTKGTLENGGVKNV